MSVRWQSVKEIVSQALSLETANAKREYIEEACRGNPALRAEVESLLQDRPTSSPLSIFDSLTGQRLGGRYQVVEKVATGGMATVYRALDTRMHRPVILKVFPPALLRDEYSKRRLGEEAKCLASLNHPHIVTIYNLEEANGFSFLVMEEVHGKKLSERVPQGGLAPDGALQYAIQIAEALVKAHSEGIIHRDLKPSNILVTDEDTVKLIDFGLAKDMKAPVPSDEVTQPGTLLGTIGYVSPEQIRGERADARSDVFSFGVVLFEMLIGMAPFKRRSSVDTIAAVLKEEPPLDRLPVFARPLVQRCLQKAPAERFQTMAEVLSELQRVTGIVRDQHDLAGRRLIRTGRRYKWSMAVAAGVLGVAAVLWGLRSTAGNPASNRVEASVNENPSRTVVLVLPFVGEGSRWATDAVVSSLKQSTQDARDIAIHLSTPKSFKSQDTESLLRLGVEQGAIFMVWGELSPSSERIIVTARIGVLQDLGFHANQKVTTIVFAMQDHDVNMLQRRIGTPVRYLSLLVLGVKRYTARNWDGTIQALTSAVEEPASSPDIADVNIARFYRALAYAARVDAGPCFKANVPGCNIDGALLDLRHSAQDFDAILETRPDHPGAHWNRGVVSEKICQLQQKIGDPAQSSCERAIQDFSAALEPVRLRNDSFTSLPDEGDVLYNRGYAHLLEASLKTLAPPARRAHFAAALRDFDHLLNGGARYASLLNRRRQAVVEFRKTAEEQTPLILQ